MTGTYRGGGPRGPGPPPWERKHLQGGTGRCFCRANFSIFLQPGPPPQKISGYVLASIDSISKSWLISSVQVPSNGVSTDISTFNTSKFTEQSIRYVISEIGLLQQEKHSHHTYDLRSYQILLAVNSLTSRLQV